MSEELDDIGRETAAMMKTMIQLATLVALRARHHQHDSHGEPAHGDAGRAMRRKAAEDTAL